MGLQSHILPIYILEVKIHLTGSIGNFLYIFHNNNIVTVSVFTLLLLLLWPPWGFVPLHILESFSCALLFVFVSRRVCWHPLLFHLASFRNRRGWGVLDDATLLFSDTCSIRGFDFKVHLRFQPPIFLLKFHQKL